MALLGSCAYASTVSESNGLWTIENDSLRVIVSPASGLITVRDKVANYDWQQSTPTDSSSSGPRFRRARRLIDGIAFEADFGQTKGKPNTVNVTMSLADHGSDLVIDASMNDMSTEIDSVPFLDPFVFEETSGVLEVADYSNGHLYPLCIEPFPIRDQDCSRMDMPWVGVSNLKSGFGYAMIIDTSDDARLHYVSHKVVDRNYNAPQVVWTGSKGTFAYPRRVIYRFVSKGGYVALAKAFRTYAQSKGMLVTLAEKAKKNPNITRLFGAPDIWGDSSLSFAREAKTAGVEKMLIHGDSIPEEIKSINELGYLTSNYDNYTDIEPLKEGQTVDSSHDVIPDSVVLKADGTRQQAWLTWDKKTQYMKRCPSLWVTAAKKVIPSVLNDHPFMGRFIDVTTAEGLYECYDPNHPLTKTAKRKCGVDLLSYVRSQKLVVGGEHGIWWGVPYEDYIEGMMSGGYTSWPAGYLIHPKTKEDKFAGPNGSSYPSWDMYAKFGIGYQYRIPLWEMVFHDCVVSTWYWGDSSDFLMDAAPEVTARKNAFNILYGTMPMMWANDEGSWKKDRKQFMTTYRNTCKLHEDLAGQELLSHEYLTSDLTVQQTHWSDGTQVTVNFGPKYQNVYLGKSIHSLPMNGFAVKGPNIEQFLEYINGKKVTTIRKKGYLFTDISGTDITMRLVKPDFIRLNIGKGDKPVTIRPGDAGTSWDTETCRAWLLNSKGERVDRIQFKIATEAATPGVQAQGNNPSLVRRGTQAQKTNAFPNYQRHEALVMGPFSEDTAIDLVCRTESN